MKIKFLLFLLFFFSLQSTFAIKTWNPVGSSTSWKTASNWTGGLPDIIDTALFTSTSVKNCTIDTSFKIKALIIAVGYSGIFNDAGFACTTMTACSLGIKSTGTIQASGKWTMIGDGPFYLRNTGIYNATTWNLDFQGNDSFVDVNASVLPNVYCSSTGKTCYISYASTMLGLRSLKTGPGNFIMYKSSGSGIDVYDTNGTNLVLGGSNFSSNGGALYWMLCDSINNLNIIVPKIKIVNNSGVTVYTMAIYNDMQSKKLNLNYTDSFTLWDRGATSMSSSVNTDTSKTEAWFNNSVFGDSTHPMYDIGAANSLGSDTNRYIIHLGHLKDFGDGINGGTPRNYYKKVYMDTSLFYTWYNFNIMKGFVSNSEIINYVSMGTNAVDTVCKLITNNQPVHKVVFNAQGSINARDSIADSTNIGVVIVNMGKYIWNYSLTIRDSLIFNGSDSIKANFNKVYLTLLNNALLNITNSGIVKLDSVNVVASGGNTLLHNSDISVLSMSKTPGKKYIHQHGLKLSLKTYTNEWNGSPGNQDTTISDLSGSQAYFGLPSKIAVTNHYFKDSKFDSMVICTTGCFDGHDNDSITFKDSCGFLYTTPIANPHITTITPYYVRRSKNFTLTGTGFGHCISIYVGNILCRVLQETDTTAIVQSSSKIYYGNRVLHLSNSRGYTCDTTIYIKSGGLLQ